VKQQSAPAKNKSRIAQQNKKNRSHNIKPNNNNAQTRYTTTESEPAPFKSAVNTTTQEHHSRGSNRFPKRTQKVVILS